MTAKDVYTNYYMYFGKDGEDPVTRWEDSVKGEGYPMILLKRGDGGVKAVKHGKNLPAGLKNDFDKHHFDYNKYRHEIKDGIRIDKGEVIEDLQHRQYIFDFDKDEDDGKITVKNRPYNGNAEESAYFESVEEGEGKVEIIREDIKPVTIVGGYSRGIRKEASFKGIVREYEVTNTNTEDNYLNKGLIPNNEILYPKTAQKIINIYPRSSRYYTYKDQNDKPASRYNVDKDLVSHPGKTRWGTFEKDKKGKDKEQGEAKDRKRGKTRKRTKQPTTTLKTSAFKMNIIPKTKNNTKIRNPTRISVSVPKLGNIKVGKIKIPKLKI